MEDVKIKNYSMAEYQIRKEILEFLKNTLKGNFEETSVEILYPPNQSLGDFALPCFQLAKKVGEKPHILSKSLAQEFEAKKAKHGKNLISKAQNFGPYLNFFMTKNSFAKKVLEEILSTKEKFGNATFGKGKRVMIEYSQPNTHKEFHVGHLRNVCIGSALVNLYQSLGYKVISANYIGDIGSHVAKCLWAYLKFHKDDELPENKGKYLGKIYTDANRLCEENDNYNKEVSLVLQKLEAGDKELKQLWKKTREWCINEFQAIYKRIGVRFDIYFYESEVEREGKKIVRELLKKGIAQKSEGAVIIDLEKYGLKKFLLLKSDTTSLYSTKDLALAQIKFKKYKVEKSYYVVDARQSFYFQQLFKTLELMGFKKEMIHIPYEFVTLKQGAMSSRNGNVVLFEDFEKEMIEKVTQETKKRHPEWKSKEIDSASFAIAYAAMKYNMLSYGNNTLIYFDAHHAMQLSGNTGPYLQYVHARISSILKKANMKHKAEGDYSHLHSPEEMALIKTLAKFPAIINQAAIKFEPSVIASYLYELAKEFSLFYENISVLNAPNEARNERINLVTSVKIVMAKGLQILGIHALERM